MGNVFGPSVDTDDVSTAVSDTIAYWIDSYLAQKERVKGWAIPTIARPRSYNATFDYENWPEGQLPGIAIVCPGTVDDPLYFGSVSAWFEVAVDVIVSDQSEALARRVAAVYQSALSMLLTQQADLSGSGDTRFATDVRLQGWELDLPDVENRTLAVGSATFHVLVSDIFDPSTRPLAPGDGDPGPYPDAESTNLTLDAVPASEVP